MVQEKTMSYQDFRQLVKQAGELTISETRLNSYIEEHFSELPYHGIVDLAKNADVSKATVGRFMNKLGYIGYARFKQDLSRSLKHKTLSAPIDIHKPNNSRGQSDSQTVLHNFVGNIQNLIEDFASTLNIEQLDEVIDLLLDNDRKIYVVGPSSSAAMAQHFSTLFIYIRTNIEVINLDSGELPKQLLDIRENDVLLVFSYYRFNKTVLSVAEWFKRKEGHVVLITNSSANPYGKYCDIQFVVPSHAHTIFQSRIAGFMFIELLLHLCYEHDQTTDNFDALEEVFKFFGTFAP